MSITPAFSPGPWMTHGASVGSVRRWMREDLYEQCSFHIAEKMPSSVKLGVRPISLRRRSYSSGLRPCAATSAGVIFGGCPIALLACACLDAGVRVGGVLAEAFPAAAFLDAAFLGAAFPTLVLLATARFGCGLAFGLDVMGL